jgi:hypothetical protein
MPNAAVPHCEQHGGFGVALDVRHVAGEAGNEVGGGLDNGVRTQAMHRRMRAFYGDQVVNSRPYGGRGAARAGRPYCASISGSESNSCVKATSGSAKTYETPSCTLEYQATANTVLG